MHLTKQALKCKYQMNIGHKRTLHIIIIIPVWHKLADKGFTKDWSLHVSGTHKITEVQDYMYI